MRPFAHKWLFAAAFLLYSAIATADPLAAPGDLRLRHDLQLLNDTGVIDVPLTAWPLSLGDVNVAVKAANRSGLDADEQAAFERVRDHLAWELEEGTVRFRFGLSGAENPRIIRGFENTPREDGEALIGLQWFGERFALNLSATYAANPFDGEELRPDGTYIGAALGNWLLTAGWQERWWGPSRDGSLILGTNARPTPGLMLQRNLSTPFETKWLSWMGPWTLSTFMTQLDDDRVINDALLFGVRGSFRPPGTGLEIGISRSAQWCGDDRPCDMDTFINLLLGKDNSGVNVDPENEPGNQLGGFDMRWRLPKKMPVALYMQWIAEDGRGGGGAIGNWLRQFGAETWMTVGEYSLRVHAEVSDSMSRQGGFGFSDPVFNYAYNHYIYRTGYRYQNRALGHGMDNDGLMYSIGSTIVGENGHTWNISLRSVEINRNGRPDARHSLSPTPMEQIDALITHERLTRFGRFHAGVGYIRVSDEVLGNSISDMSGFIRWSSN